MRAPRRGPPAGFWPCMPSVRPVVRVRFETTAHEGGRVVQLSQARSVLGRPWVWVSAYWVDGVLIDAGPSHARAQLLAWTADHRLEGVWVTHHHEDHVGNVGALQAQRDLPAYASARAIERARALRLPPYRRYTWGDPDVGTLRPVATRLETRHQRFDVVPVPGHTAGDVAYVEPEEGWAFSGDLFLSVSQVITRPREDLGTTIRSLERLLEFEPRVLFTGMRVFQQASQVLRDRLVFLQQVLHDLEHLRGTGLTQTQARRRRVGRETLIHYVSGGDFAKQHFVRQAYECLDRHPRVVPLDIAAGPVSSNLGTTEGLGPI